MVSINEFRELDCGDITCNLDDFVAGSGGFGDVLFGYHNGLKQEVAIKIFEVSGGTQDKARLEKTIKEEMEHLQKADHENVVRVFGYVKWTFAIGIVMEYYKGGNLKELLQDTSKELGLAVRVRILYEIASAMAVCHNLPDKRLIHQDLKPENVMFTEELHCKIIDFGAAELATCSISANVNPLARSKKERPQYTLYYTAPEKLEDLTMKPRKQHDVYAFSMTIYWALARKAPYPSLTDDERRELLEEIKRGKRPDCQETQDWIQTLVGEDREIAEQLQLLMKRCWDQDPTKRPTMTEIKEELKRHLDKQNTTKILSQVVKTLTQMGLDEQPQVSEGQRVPLHYFSTRSRSFHVPSTSVDTKEQSTEPTDGAQEHVQSFTLNRETSTSSRPQQLDTIRHGADGRSTTIQNLIARFNSPPPQQPAVPSTSNNSAERSTQLTGGAHEVEQTSIQQGEEEDQTDEFNQHIQNYVDLLKTKKYDEAKTTKQQLSRSITGQPGVTAENLEEKATKFKNDGKYLEAILLFSIAADFYVKKNPDIAGATSVVVCAKEIRQTIKLLMENSDLSSKSRNTEIVRDHVISLMRDMFQQIRDLQINVRLRCEKEVWCLYYIEWCQHYIGDLASRETTIKLGLEIMETNFENESSNYEIYGILLRNLGVVCVETLRFKEAIEHFTKAIEVYKRAEDLTKERRREYIAISEMGLQFNKAKLNE